MPGRFGEGHWLVARALALAATIAAATPALAGEPLTYDRVHFSVSAEADVANDTLVAVLYVQREGQQQARVSEQVNEAMRWALERARAAGEVKAQTLTYDTNPVYQDRRIVGWRARQSLRLESKNAVALTALIGELQARMAVQSVSYEVSKAARDAAEAQLIERALAAFRQRAERIARTMQRPGYRLVDMNVATDGQRAPPVRMRAQMAQAEGVQAQPALEAGEQSLSVTVSGTVELQTQQ